MVLWANVMRLVPEGGIAVAELERQARTDKLQLSGLERWGYIVVAPDPTDPRAKPPQRDWLVRPSAIGRKAQEVWRPLAGIIEERWRARFGKEEIDALRQSLSDVLSQIDLAMPAYLPILGYGLFSQIIVEETHRSYPSPQDKDTLADLQLHALLAKVLLAFTIEFEFNWKISLPVSANGLRLLSKEGTRLGDIPRRAGISKQGIAFATGWLERSGYAMTEPDSTASRGKIIRLTAKGLEAQQAYLQRLELVETHWRERFGKEEIAKLRESLDSLIHKRDGEQALLAQGLMPYPNGWRARKPYLTQTLAFVTNPAGALPHHPMVLHRGGYPDGS
jgi:DNA-binding MarR family transcriptional regulator